MKCISLADEESCNVRPMKRFQGQLRSAMFMQFGIIFASCFLLRFKLQFLSMSKEPCLFSSLTFLINSSLMFIKGTFLRTAWAHWMVSIFSVSSFEAHNRSILSIWFSTFYQITYFIFYECTDYCSNSQENMAKRRGDGLNPLFFYFSTWKGLSFFSLSFYFLRLAWRKPSPLLLKANKDGTLLFLLSVASSQVTCFDHDAFWDIIFSFFFLFNLSGFSLPPPSQSSLNFDAP